jgi:YfiH family protein
VFDKAMTPEPAVTSGPAGSGVSWFERGQYRPVRGIRRRFTTRHGGVSKAPYDSLNLGGSVADDPSAVVENRARVASDAGLSPVDVVWMRQVHGSTVTAVTAGAPESGLPPCDGVVTDRPGIGLAVLVADCVPILAGDPTAGVIAAVHAGRRGAADGIAVRMLERMTALGAEPDGITVVLGPAICGACYEVPSSMRDEVAEQLPGSASTTDRGTPGLDLRAGLAAQLRAGGVAQVVVDPSCTYTEPSLFSHRRGAPTGRFAGLIWMPH